MADGFWVEVLQTGTFTDMHGQTVTFNEQDLDMMVAAFDGTKDELMPPIRLGTHNPLGISGGWIGGMRRVEDRLQANFQELLPGIREMFEKKLYRTVSAGVKFGKEVGGKKWARFVDHVAVLGKHLPAIKTLQDIQALMSEEKAEAYAVSEVDEDVRVFTVFSEEEKEADMADEHKVDGKAFDKLLERVSTLETNLSESETARSEAVEKAAGAEKRADEAEKSLKTHKVELSEKAQTESKTSMTEFCESRVKDLKMSPAARDALLKDLEVQFSEDGDVLIPWKNVRAFTEAGGLAKKGEQGLGGEDEQDEKPDVALAEKTAEFMAANPGTEYGKAASIVRAANPKLAKAHAEMHGKGGE